MSSPAGVQLSQIGQIAVNVHDVERATAFYRDVLGMRHLFSVPPKLAFFDLNGIRLMLTTPEQPEFAHPASILYYKVENIHSAVEALKAKKVHIEGEPHCIAKLPDHDLWMAFFRDTEENLLALMSEVRSS